MNNKPFKTLTSNVVWSCPWYAVRQDKILLPNGEIGEYNTIVKETAVWILPVTPAGEIVLLRHYRYTVDDWCWEIPAGGVKPGQTPAEAARAELREEIGGQAQTLEWLGQFYTANGICNEVGHYFLAAGVTLGPTAREPAELMEIHPAPIAEVLRMARAGQISDAPSTLVILLCETALQNLLTST
ncbi:MAG: NUDIX hydrolase [Chloroflexi bacterium]|nr:NUDIX hydrolase [Chloroflexota bacterium]